MGPDVMKVLVYCVKQASSRNVNGDNHPEQGSSVFRGYVTGSSVPKLASQGQRHWDNFKIDEF